MAERSVGDFLVKDTWFKGFIVGNVLWPQTMRGIFVFTLDAIIKDPPQTWEHLQTAFFSPPQLDRLGKIMSSQHHRRGINYATAAYQQPNDRMVTDDRFHILWETAIDIAGDRIARFILKDEEVSAEDLEDKQIDQLLFDPSAATDLAEFRRIMQTAKALYSGRLGVTLAKYYRLYFTEKQTLDQRNERNRVLVARFPQLRVIAEKYGNIFDPLPAYNQVMDFLMEEALPDTYLGWFYLGVANEALGI